MLIEILMTVALALYFLAFYLARKVKWRPVHITVALIAFFIDVQATIMMYQMDLHLDNWVVILHTYLGLLALSLFLVQGYLGMMRKRKQHIFFAKYIFLPVWVVSYSSGALFFLV